MPPITQKRWRPVRERQATINDRNVVNANTQSQAYRSSFEGSAATPRDEQLIGASRNLQESTTKEVQPFEISRWPQMQVTKNPDLHQCHEQTLSTASYGLLLTNHSSSTSASPHHHHQPLRRRSPTKPLSNSLCSLHPPHSCAGGTRPLNKTTACPSFSVSFRPLLHTFLPPFHSHARRIPNATPQRIVCCLSGSATAIAVSTTRHWGSGGKGHEGASGRSPKTRNQFDQFGKGSQAPNGWRGKAVRKGRRRHCEASDSVFPPCGRQRDSCCCQAMAANTTTKAADD